MVMTHSAGRAGTRPHRPRRTRRLYLVPILLVLIGLGAATSFVGYVLWPRWPDAAVTLDAPSIPVSVAGVAFNVPPAAVRMAVQRKPGAQDRIDLVFLWPSLAPPDPANKTTPAVNAEMPLEQIHPPDRIFLTISGTNNTLAPPERRRTIYPRYLALNRTSGPAGLMVVPFRDGTPYQSEDFITHPAEPDRFPVRCTRAGAGNTPGTCLHERRIDTADMIIRFPRAWLEDWRGVAENVDRLIARLHPPR